MLKPYKKPHYCTPNPLRLRNIHQKTHFFILSKVLALCAFLQNTLKNHKNSPYSKGFRRAQIPKEILFYSRPPSVSFDHLNVPSTVGSGPFDPTALVHIGLALTSESYLPISVRGRRQASATCHPHNVSEVHLTFLPPYQKRCNMKPLTTSGFG